MPEEAASTRNRVLIEMRKARGWGRGRLAAEFERAGETLGLNVPTRSTMEKAIYRHETGQSRVTDEIYVSLYCSVYERSAHELFGDLSSSADDLQTRFAVTSHKFLPLYVGPDAVSAIGDKLGASPSVVEWSECWAIEISHPRSSCTLYGLPWGCIVFHIEDDLNLSSIAELALWRHESYIAELEWASVYSAETLSVSQRPEYILSAYWMLSPKWRNGELTSAMRLICTPRVLIDHDVTLPASHADLVERSFLRDGYSDRSIIDFGVSGISLGYASWAGVSYFPLGGRRALPARTLIHFEILVQSLWCFCHHVRSHVEAGRDPALIDGYNWKWLRGVGSRLTNARPQETTQHVAMRVAILQSSDLANQLNATVDILRDTSEGQWS